MWWGQRKQAREDLEQAFEVLERAHEKAAYVEHIVTQLEEAKARNHFGDGMKAAMRRKGVR